jgi:hypothetical protein
MYELIEVQKEPGGKCGLVLKGQGGDTTLAIEPDVQFQRDGKECEVSALKPKDQIHLVYKRSALVGVNAISPKLQKKESDANTGE